jgi:synaptobrevin family protein YKT6
MKVFALILVNSQSAFGEPSLLSREYKLSDFSRMKHGTIKDICKFLARTLVLHIRPGQKGSVVHEQFNVHICHMSSGLAVVGLTDHEYPQRVMKEALGVVLEKFLGVHREDWHSQRKKDDKLPFPELKRLLASFQDPRDVDSIYRLQTMSNELIEIVTESISQVVIRGERLENLMVASDDLSARAKMFYKESKKKNCCTLL